MAARDIQISATIVSYDACLEDRVSGTYDLIVVKTTAPLEHAGQSLKLILSPGDLPLDSPFRSSGAQITFTVNASKLSKGTIRWTAVRNLTEVAADANWNKTNEDALRKLIADEDVIIEMYRSEGKYPFPLQRLYVPNSFVELYKKSPVDCLTVLADIVERGDPHDAIVAFQFGLAGAEPQVGLPLFHYLSEKSLEETFSDGETYRQCCLRIIRNELKDKKKLVIMMRN